MMAFPGGRVPNGVLFWVVLAIAAVVLTTLLVLVLVSYL